MRDEPLAKLVAKVQAVNLCHQEAAAARAALTKAFAPLVGETLEKVDGQLLRKVGALVPYLNGTPDVTACRARCGYSLAWDVKAFVRIEGGCSGVYHETRIYIGKMEGRVLTAMEDRQTDFRTNYTVEEVAKKRAAHQAAYDALSDARSALWPFDTHDN